MREVRVMRAIKLLQGLAPDQRFDMLAWGQGDLNETLAELTEDDLRNGCGTAACALGWIASTEAARAEGLRLVIPKYGDSYLVEYRQFRTKEPLTGIDAAWRYFGFEFEVTAQYLFLPTKYGLKISRITPAMVANRMQIILDIGEAAFLADKDVSGCRDVLAVPQPVSA